MGKMRLRTLALEARQAEIQVAEPRMAPPPMSLSRQPQPQPQPSPSPSPSPSLSPSLSPSPQSSPQPSPQLSPSPSLSPSPTRSLTSGLSSSPPDRERHRKHNKARENEKAQGNPRKDPHEIAPYPSDSRLNTAPLWRYARYAALRAYLYGPISSHVDLIYGLERRWSAYPVLPPSLPPDHCNGVLPSPWLPRGFEADQQQKTFRWWNHCRTSCSPLQTVRELDPVSERAKALPSAANDLTVFLGPFDAQVEVRIPQLSGLAVLPSGLPYRQTQAPPQHGQDPAGWILDAGAIPLAAAWAPLLQRKAQLLAIAAVPFSDQEQRPAAKAESAEAADENQGATADPATTQAGSIQFWEFIGEAREGALPKPSPAAPKLAMVKHLYGCGQPKRLQWSPVALDPAGLYGILAILCGDGKVRVLEIKIPEESGKPHHELIETPLATLGLDNEYLVRATCLTWTNSNRLVLGHSDGSLTLWSLHPRQLLQRIAAHHTYIVDICSAYPSHPYLVASVPVSGCITLTDLSHPSAELTCAAQPTVNFQPNLLAWSEPLQGFVGLYPSSSPFTTLAFMHHRSFPQVRSICTATNPLTCTAAGATHPILLAGAEDGSVVACNGLQKVFKPRNDPVHKIRLLEHEYRPIGEASEAVVGEGDSGVKTAQPGPIPRGAVRILQGFAPEPNEDPRMERRKPSTSKLSKNGLRKGRPRGKKDSRNKTGKGDSTETYEDRQGDQQGEEGEEGERQGRDEIEVNAGAREGRRIRYEEEDEGGADFHEDRAIARLVTHEPLTRTTVVTWNPNPDHSCWAAMALASGLVRVMDLGVS